MLVGSNGTATAIVSILGARLEGGVQGEEEEA